MNPYFDQFNTLWGVSHNPDGTQISGTATSPWSTALAATLTSGSTSFATTNALPVTTVNQGSPSFPAIYMVVDAWTSNAEARMVTSDSTGRALTLESGSTSFQHSHTAGASVVYVQDAKVYLDWWGAVNGFNGGSTTASTNVTAVRNCFAQLPLMSAGFNYGFNVYGNSGHYMFNDEIVIPGHGLSSLNGVGVNCISDYGSGKHAISNPTGAIVSLEGCSVTSSNPAMSMATYLSGGSNPPVAMDGIHCTDRMTVLGCSATGFHAGFHLDFFDHATMRDCFPSFCQYGYSFAHAGGIGGDMEFTKCDGGDCYRAIWGMLPSDEGLAGVSWRDCSWTNAPFAFFGLGGLGIQTGIMLNCNVEFLGNGFMYSTGDILLWLNYEKPGSRSFYPTGGTWTDPNFPSAAAIQAAGNITVRDTSLVAPYPGSVSYLFDAPAGSVTFSNVDIATDTSGSPSGVVLTGGVGSTSGRLTFGTGRSTGFACVGTSGTIVGGDLLEHNPVTGKQQRSQTAGAPPSGVAIWAPSNGTTSTADTGVVAVNCGTNTIVAGKYVKADLSDPGYVATVLALNPQNFWELGETSFASQAADAASGGHGTYTNTSGLAFSQTGIVGGGGATAVKFTAASSGYVNINSGITNVGDTFTIECWLKLTSVGTAQTIIGSQAGAFRLGISASGNLEASRPSNPVIVDSTSTLSADGNFHHLVWTKATSTNKLYIDGVDVTGSVTNATCGFSNAWNIGADPVGSGNLLNGTLQFLAVYTTALTSGNASANYTAGSTSTTGSSAGKVIQASSFSDGPIVGRSLAASASNQVKVKLTI